MAAPNSANHIVNCRMKDSFIEQTKKKLISSVLKIKIIILQYEITFHWLNKTLVFLFSCKRFSMDIIFRDKSSYCTVVFKKSTWNFPGSPVT